MEIKNTSFPGLLIIKPTVFTDPRGSFYEFYHQQKFLDAGLKPLFIQDNISISHKGAIRGLHYQLSEPQTKLVSVLKGKIYDVAVDLRKGSPTFGQWFSQELSETNHLQLLIPEGFAHGFIALSYTIFLYKCSNYYAGATHLGIRWNDPDLAITWPIKETHVSEKDKALPFLKDIAPENFPIMNTKEQ